MKIVSLALLCAAIPLVAASELHHATTEKLPRWRGFNLLEKFHLDWSNGPFLEEDFKLISELGFNFVRLPMDYRTWIVDGDWRRFNEDILKEIDQAVAWGGQYGIHVCLNFHRAPGYTVASPKEEHDLWTDSDAQEVFALHWATFARRYKGIPNDRLSFNLVNEPSDVSAENHAAVVEQVVAAIRAEDPDRLIIADGRMWGRVPCDELIGLGVAQATRGYEPMGVTHYQASWIANADAMPLPQWPQPEVSSFLYGTWKADLQSPLRIEGDLREASALRLRVGMVSTRAVMMVRADGTTVWEHTFEPGPGEGEWKEVRYVAEYDCYQNRYDRDYAIEIPVGTHAIEVSIAEGDWLGLSELGLRVGDAKEAILATTPSWGLRHLPLRVVPSGDGFRLEAAVQQDRAWLKSTMVAPWQALEAKGVGVMVGEWGAFNKTPHDVVLRWAEDCLANWQEAGWGWALWNFRGSFGILDSGREDVDYEEWRGHKLDRALLDLLQRY